ncbi:hypothetical protein UA32_12280 [Photobacterium angustum]|uniref:Phosphoadenosine phosphosulphate reductase domain-containing protein n=1 Tax=Photobacterium angustum TaxID=661 RepID=A0ABX5GYJ5_PHOAN|nr:phosphoadenosine phosphosulfate reductase family protein [Photobacterium angustum]KJG37729.1 hypothetical protein UA32_12280 [Photobacterium angustum]PSX03936.1 hypothetical protein C0W27_20800 [Photobacterium angustum]
MDWLNKLSSQQVKVKKQDRKLFAKKSIELLVEYFLNNSVLPTCCLSYGKDSMSMLSVTLLSWKLAIDKKPQLAKIPFVIAYSDTRVEMPIKVNYIDEINQIINNYAKEHNILVSIVKASPPVQSSWQGKIVGGSIKQWDVRLGRGNGCAVDWKIATLKKALKYYDQVAKSTGLTLVKFIGVRNNESAIRDVRNAKLGLNMYQTHELNGEYCRYPILNWSLSDVWDYLLFCENTKDSPLPGISDGFPQTVKFYNSMSSSECSAIDGQASSCEGGRDGCFLCAANPSVDLDIDLIQSNPHVKPLVEYRLFMLANNLNIYNRSYVQPRPSVIGEYKATSHSGAYLLDLLRIGLTIQEREKERAAHEKMLVDTGLHLSPETALIEPQFTIFESKDIAFIDFNWMIRGLQIEPSAALKAYFDIVFNGMRYDIPNGYKRNVPYAEDPAKDTGTVYYEDLLLEDDFDFNIENLTQSWQFANDDEFDVLFGSHRLISAWLTESDHAKVAARWISSGLIKPPKSQAERIFKRVQWVTHIYDNNLHHLSFKGGPYLTTI